MADYGRPAKPGIHDQRLPGYIERAREYQDALPQRPRPTSEFEKEVNDIYDELKNLLLSKHKDYGSKNISDSPGGPLNGLRVRIHDKQARINNLLDNNKTPEHESLEDSFKDMANYAIIGLLVLRGKWDSK